MDQPNRRGLDLLTAAARLQRWTSRHAQIGLPIAQVRLLAQLEETGRVRIGDLARFDDCSQPTMSSQVQRLEDQGWARRRPDPSDGRASLVELTAAGRRALARARAVRAAALEPVLARLSAADLEQIDRAADAVELLLAATREVSAAG